MASSCGHTAREALTLGAVVPCPSRCTHTPPADRVAGSPAAGAEQQAAGPKPPCRALCKQTAVRAAGYRAACRPRAAELLQTSLSPQTRTRLVVFFLFLQDTRAPALTISAGKGTLARKFQATQWSFCYSCSVLIDGRCLSSPFNHFQVPTTAKSLLFLHKYLCYFL